MPSLEANHTITHAHVGLSADRPVRSQFLRLEAGESVSPHDHDYFEISVVHEGAGSHRSGCYERPLAAGSVLIVPPGPVHALEAKAAVGVTNVYYLSEWLLDDLRLLRTEEGLAPLFLSAALFGPRADALIPHFELTQPELARCEEELQALDEAGQTPQPSLLLQKASLSKLMVYLCRAWRRQPHAAAQGYRREVWQSIDVIEQAVLQGAPFQLRLLAEDLELSPDHLGRVFRDATGRTIGSYYQHRRIQHTQRLLLNPQHSITEVAHMAGYCDAAHFCNQFRRLLGITPNAYRARYGAC